MLSYIAWIILRPVYFIISCVFSLYRIDGKENIPTNKPLIAASNHIEEKENIPTNKPLIVVSNHIGELDPWRIGPHLPFSMQVYWFAKKELYDYKSLCGEYRDMFGVLTPLMAIVIKTVVSLSLTMPVDRENPSAKENIAALRRAVEILKSGGVIGIFPEGGINREGEANPSFVKLAKKRNVSILPVRIDKGRVVFGQLISLAEDARSDQQIAEEVMSKIYGM